MIEFIKKDGWRKALIIGGMVKILQKKLRL